MESARKATSGAGSSFRNPSGVHSSAQASRSEMGKPIASTTRTSVPALWGSGRYGKAASTTWSTTKAATRYMPAARTTFRRLSSRTRRASRSIN